MKYLKRFAKILLFIFMNLLILGFILSTLYYFNIINKNIYNIMKITITLIILFTSAFLSAKKCEKYGIIEGIKIGIIFLFTVKLIPPRLA